MNETMTIKPNRPDGVDVTIPGSKSYTHRSLIAAALAEGTSTVSGCLRSEDTLLTVDALRKLGVTIEDHGNGTMTVCGTGGRIRAAKEPVFLSNSGTSMRLLTAIAGLGDGPTVLDGGPRMRERPIHDLLEALKKIGIPAESLENSDCPPVVVGGGSRKGGKTEVACHLSSQFLSGLLLMAPVLEDGLEISVTKGPVSKPYIRMTVEIMERMGIAVMAEGDTFYKVSGGQSYRPGGYVVEPDASNCSYFFASAAVTGGSVTVRNVSRASGQGDMKLLSVFEAMGCTVTESEEGVSLSGGKLSSVDVDMSDMPDMVPTLAVVAAFATGTTRIRNVHHLREKECDRLSAVATELSKMGAKVTEEPAGLVIEGGHPLHGASIHTYDDHRIAMCFAFAGLVVDGMVIEGPECVAKSFPNFWDEFAKVAG